MQQHYYWDEPAMCPLHEMRSPQLVAINSQILSPHSLPHRTQRAIPCVIRMLYHYCQQDLPLCFNATALVRPHSLQGLGEASAEQLQASAVALGLLPPPGAGAPSAARAAAAQVMTQDAWQAALPIART